MIEILKLKEQKPTLFWQERLAMGDDNFTKQTLDETNVLLDNCVNDLANLSDSATENEKVEIIKNAILKLNTLDTQHEFIFELESEELIDFFNELASQAGVDLKHFEDEDVTFEWREF